MNILILNLNKSITEAMLLEHFRPYGSINSAIIATDKLTGRSKGFGFVEMPNPVEGLAAIKAMNHTKFCKEIIKLKQSRPLRSEPKQSEDIQVGFQSSARSSAMPDNLTEARHSSVPPRQRVPFLVQKSKFPFKRYQSTQKSASKPSRLAPRDSARTKFNPPTAGQIKSQALSGPILVFTKKYNRILF